MSLDYAQQLEKMFESAREVLILLAENATGDAVGSAFALSFFLEKKNVFSTIALTRRDEILQRFEFLEKPKNISDNIAGSRDFMLSFNTKYNKIGNVRTQRDENELRIFITPEKGSIDPRDFSFIPARFKYDLIFVLDSPDKESLGKIYEENPDIFYEVPVVNIDHHGENDKFGQINIVDVTASSTAEILTEILEKIDLDALDEKISQCLLLGVIEATNSFQRKNTTPKSLQLSAMLMGRGADQQEIVRYLYKTQPFHLLKLWGRIMARLVWDEELCAVWAPVFLDDFVQSRSNPHDAIFILEKIKDNYANGKFFMVLFNETPELVRGIVKCTEIGEAKKIAQEFEGFLRNDEIDFVIRGNDAKQAGEKVIEKMKKIRF